jgi:hypothetical protein
MARGKSERAATLGRYATDVTDYVAADGATEIAITANVHDMPGLEAMLASPSPDDGTTMERHGVIPPVTVYIEK